MAQPDALDEESDVDSVVDKERVRTLVTELKHSINPDVERPFEIADAKNAYLCLEEYAAEAADETPWTRIVMGIHKRVTELHNAQQRILQLEKELKELRR